MTRHGICALVCALFIVLTAVPAQASVLGDAPVAGIDPVLVEQLEAIPPDHELLVFVHGTNAAVAREAVLEGGLRLVDTFDRVSVAVGVGTPEAIRSLEGAEGVRHLEADRPIELFLDTSHQATRGAELTEGFVAGDETVVQADGSGVTVAIVDSGIDGTHPMFEQDGESKVVRNLKLACNQTTPIFFHDGQGNPVLPPPLCPEDHGLSELQDAFWLDLTEAGNDTDTPSAGGHGTHVAATAAGVGVTTADGRVLQGAAPGAKLVGLSIGNSLSIYGGTAGLNWVLNHHAQPCGASSDDCPPIKVVNNSWGISGGGEFWPGSVVTRIQRELVADGVTVVWAAGNDGGTGSDNRSSIWAQDPTPGVLGVANYNDAGRGARDGFLNQFSSRGQDGRPETYPDISAPGTNITAACRIYLPVCSTGFDTADPDYDTISGTSMAAPHIAGIVAQLVELEPALTPAAIQDALKRTAHKFIGGGGYEPDPANPGVTISFDKGAGLVDVAEAAAHVVDTTAPPAERQCFPDSPVVLDDEGDATGLVLVPSTPLASEPSLDILSGALSFDPIQDELTFHISVLDLSSTPSVGHGNFFRFFFDHAGEGFQVTALRDDLDGFEAFTLRNAASTTLATLSGSFIDELNRVDIELPLTVLNAHASQDLGEGSTLAGFEILGQRFAVAFTLTADWADQVCPFTLGEEAENEAPTAVIDAPDRVRAGETAVFDGSGSSDPDGEVVAWDWDMGDGTELSGEVVEHAYLRPGPKDVVLTVTDDRGATGTSTHRIRVQGPPA